jgi:hypothetical protein
VYNNKHISHLIFVLVLEYPQWNFMCYYTKVYINIIPTIHKNYRKQNKQPKRKLVRQHIFSRNDRLFIDPCDVIARANMENCYQYSSWGNGFKKSRNNESYTFPNIQWTNDGSKVVHNIKHRWVIMWHIFTSTNNTTTILFPTQLWELLYTYHAQEGR